MPTFEVRAVTDHGKRVRVHEEARSESDVVDRLERSGLHVTRVMIVRSRDARAKHSSRLSKRQLVDFADRLQLMYAAGIPMVEAMAEVCRGTTDKRMRAIVRQVQTDVEDGTSFSEALAKFPRAFPPQFLATVRAGEETGALDVVMGRMVTQLEWEMQIRATTTQAFVYPAILAGAVMGMMTLLFTFLLPRIAKVFTSAGAELPGPTRVVMALSNFLIMHGGVILSVVLGLVAALILSRRTEQGRVLQDRLLLNLPVVGSVLRKIASARFVSALRTLHHAGTPMLNALRLARPACANATLERDILRISELVEDGVPLTEAMNGSEQLEPLVPRMVAVGEKSGSLTEALDHVVALYDREVRASTKRLLSVLEPMILIVSGVVIGFTILATLLPMFRMLGAIKS